MKKTEIKDEVATYEKLRVLMLKKRKKLAAEIARIDNALGARPPSQGRAPYGTLTTFVKGILKAGPQPKKTIIVMLSRQGYPWPAGKSPSIVLDSVIYTKHFRREGKEFRLAA
jgi:hypothetical protein